MSSITKTPVSIPKSVFYGLVKELVQDQHEEEYEGDTTTRVSATAVTLLQRTTEEYIADIFGRTYTPETKILTVDRFNGARSSYDSEELLRFHNIPEGHKTIIDYDSEDDIFE